MNANKLIEELNIYKKQLLKDLSELLQLEGQNLTVWILGIINKMLDYIVKFPENHPKSPA